MSGRHIGKGGGQGREDKGRGVERQLVTSYLAPRLEGGLGELQLGVLLDQLSRLSVLRDKGRGTRDNR